MDANQFAEVMDAIDASLAKLEKDTGTINTFGANSDKLWKLEKDIARVREMVRGIKERN